MIALLDANILIDAGKSRMVPRLVAVSASRPWRLTQEVFDELGSDVAGRSQLKPLIRPSPLLDSAEAQMAAAVVAGGYWGALGVGEASSIAAGTVDSAVEFITWDNKASWRSLHELRGRTTVGHAWLQGLVEAGLLTKVEADAIVRADPNRRHPAWW